MTLKDLIQKLTDSDVNKSASIKRLGCGPAFPVDIAIAEKDGEIHIVNIRGAHTEAVKANKALAMKRLK